MKHLEHLGTLKTLRSGLHRYSKLPMQSSVFRKLAVKMFKLSLFLAVVNAKYTLLTDH